MRGSVNLVRVWVPMTAGVLALVGMSLGSPSAVRADDEMKVEISITDRGYDVKGHSSPGSLTRIIVRNHGSNESPARQSGSLSHRNDRQ